MKMARDEALPHPKLGNKEQNFVFTCKWLSTPVMRIYRHRWTLTQGQVRDPLFQEDPNLKGHQSTAHHCTQSPQKAKAGRQKTQLGNWDDRSSHYRISQLTVEERLESPAFKEMAEGEDMWWV